MIDKQTNARLKNFAQEARRYLIDQVTTKLSEVLAPGSDASTYVGLKPLYNALLYEVTGVRQQITGDLKHETWNLEPLVEQVAYTWFNRLTAIRYMDLHHFNPVGIISPQDGDSLPQILAEAKMGLIDSTLINPEDKKRVLGLLSGTVESTYHKGDAQSEAYRILLIGACNSIGKSLPFLFKPIQDWMQLLLPDDLLGDHGILAMIREVMTPKACEDVEVIGWLYQYYISEKKDEVFAGVKKGKKIQSTDIPAVTQLFTPNWIVKYLVQNSLGRLWLESHLRSSLKDKMEYYIAQPEAEVPLERRLVSSPEEIKFCDPCCGSGHILTYAFDLLYEIYSEEGYDPLDIPRLIISKNLYGIEIDERASELAAFALSMKARQKDDKWFSRGIDPQICHLVNIRFSQDELNTYMDECGRDIFTFSFERMLSQFEDADTFGSLIVPYEQDLESIHELLNAKNLSADVIFGPIHDEVLKLVEQADFLSSKYQVVVTNPPYMGSSGFGKEKDKWFRSLYPNSRTDYFAMFMERCLSLTVKQGFAALINMQSWMFLKSYEKLRQQLVKHTEFITMAHLGPRAFDTISGEVVSTTAFVMKNEKPGNKQGAYFRLLEGRSEEEKKDSYLEAIANPNCGWFYRAKTTDFAKIPKTPFIYSISNSFRSLFNKTTLGTSARIMKGLDTCDNERFLRLWFEVSSDKSFLDINSAFVDRKFKWYSYCKGGTWRKWYGNYEHVVNWDNDGYELKNLRNANGSMKSRVQNASYYFLEGITYSSISNKALACRSIKGSIFGGGGSGVFVNNHEYIMGLLNSKISAFIMKLLNPSMNYLVDDLERLPIIDLHNGQINLKIVTILDITKADWDSYETSWDFQSLPLLDQSAEGLSLEDAFAQLRKRWIEDTLKMQELEVENNQIFIDAYGLQEELSPEVPLREITLTCNPYYRYGAEAAQQEGGIFPLDTKLEERLVADTMKELISYAVGCMFGRYCVDKPGLILANQGETVTDFLQQVPVPSFVPQRENVIPIVEGEWFGDDLASRLREFLKVTFGNDNYHPNLGYLEDALGKPLETYLLKDFYNEHVRRYKKRPIYCLFSSPKGSFNALIYLHRYTTDTVSILLNDYLREYIHKIRAKSQQLEHQLDAGALGEREKIQVRRQIERLQDEIVELEEWEAKVILPLAERRLQIDLDDGVKVNYAKFGKALKQIK